MPSSQVSCSGQLPEQVYVGIPELLTTNLLLNVQPSGTSLHGSCDVYSKLYPGFAVQHASGAGSS